MKLSRRQIAHLLLAFTIVGSTATKSAALPACAGKFQLGYEQPERQDVDPGKLLVLTHWVRDNPARILSLTLSRNGKVIYDLQSSRLDRNAAHYVMSVTKSITAALVGVALDRGLIKGTGSSVADNLPRGLFPGAEAFARLQTVTLKDVLGMSALDAELFPHSGTPEAKERSRRFFRSPDRLQFALEQPVLTRTGQDFQYTDVTPMLAGGIVQLATGMTLLDFGKQALFDPLGFANVEWMHQDRAGFDNAAYGLRLRPIDMQKLGILFLNKGCWENAQLIPSDWVATSFTPWIRSRPHLREPNYGWYWWVDRFASGWVGHTANGWKGQRITVVPAKALVITMTGIIEDGSEDRIYRDVLDRFVIPAVETSVPAGAPTAELAARLASALHEVWTGKAAIGPDTERRMIPSATPKEPHDAFQRRSFEGNGPGRE
jgi:CubicO group peptidase (beta-lactamase class C family)